LQVRNGTKKKKKNLDSAPIDMFLSAASVLVVVQLSLEFPEGLMNNPIGIQGNLQLEELITYDFERKY
jgi:hypothetical protein